MSTVTQRRPRTWPTRRITSALHAVGVTHKSLAIQLDCSRSNVSQVVGGLTKSWRVAFAICEPIGRKPWELWPRLYAVPAMPSEAPMTGPMDRTASIDLAS